MNHHDPPAQVMKFGDGLELDRTAYELRRSGRPLKLERIPMEILLLLIDRKGQLVAREEIIERVWGKDVFLDTDNSINSAIRKIRAALRDDPEKPVYLQTVTGKGYRFIAEVTVAAAPPAPESPVIEPAAEALAIQVGAAPFMPEPERSFSFSRIGFKGRRWMIWAAAAVIAGAALLAVARLRNPAPAGKLMFVVLPFVNLTGDPAQEYIADGMTEEMIAQMGALNPQHIGVIARTSAMHFKGTQKDAAQIARELGVGYLLEGSIRHVGDRVRVTAQLIQASDQTHMWAADYDQDFSDLLRLEGDIASTIAKQVQVKITPQRQLEISKMRAVSAEAMDLYLRGRFYWNQRTADALRESIPLFQKAIAADPGFALGYAGLADAYNISPLVGLGSGKESSRWAREAAIRAIQLDPSLAEAHAALGMEKSHSEFDLSGARVEFLKAIELNPSSAYAHFFYSNCYLMPMGRRTEAIAENMKAIELDPLSLPINNFLGETYLLAGDYSQSYREFQRTMAMDPNFPLPHLYLASLLELMKNFSEAISEYEKGQVLSGDTRKEASDRAAALRKSLKNGGEKGYWKEHLNQDLRAMERPGSAVSAAQVAENYALAGDKDEAFLWLDKAYEAREGEELTLLAVDPVWNNLYGDPRFSDLLRRIGLQE